MNKLVGLRSHSCQYVGPGRGDFTLLELVIATAILAVGIIGVGLAITKATYSANLDRDRIIAHLAAEQILDQIDTATASTFSCLLSGGSWASSTIDVANMLTSEAGGGQASVSTEDMGWDATTGSAIRVTIRVRSQGIILATLRKVYVPLD